MFYIKKHGFTLTELMVVVAVAAILMAAAVPTFIGARDRANTNACIANLEIIRSATREWALDNPSDAIAGHQITVAELDGYIDSGFASLKEPTTGNYDTLPLLDVNGNIPNPECSIGGDHDL